LLKKKLGVRSKIGKEAIFSAKWIVSLVTDSKIRFCYDDVKADFWLAKIKHLANES
jgi:hypothetical protein